MKKSIKTFLAITMALSLSFVSLGCAALSDAADYIFNNLEWQPDKQVEAEAVAEAEKADPIDRGYEERLDPPLEIVIANDDSVVKATELIDHVQRLGVLNDVSDVVEEVMPAMVSVSNSYIASYNYFGREFSNESESIGSGIIVGENDTELLIVTNYHVVQDADSLTVQFVDGSDAYALVKGSQPNMDLAIIAVNLEDLKADTIDSIAVATLGDSDTLRLGEPAIAIGNAMGYGQSVTTGVISALNREASYYIGSYGQSGYQIDGEFIQTNAAINPGNSGGALLNIRGEVIGINSSKIGGTSIEGMGYAIPISAAKPIIADLMVLETRARVAQEEQGFIGITGATVGDEIAELYGLPKGIYITRVFDGTAAAEAGIKEGDIITHLDGVAIPSWEELLKRMAYHRVGDEVTVTLISGDAIGGYDEAVVTLTLGSRPRE